MPTTFNYSGKPTFMYDSIGDVWYQVGGAIDTSSGYSWSGTHAFSNTVAFTDYITSKNGINNFLNPAARDAAIASPVQGTLAFVRQDGSGNTINQLQYYNGSAWTANDGDISAVSAGTGLTGGGTAGALTLSVDTTFVATTSNTMTMSNKTLTAPTINNPSVTSGTFVTPTLQNPSVTSGTFIAGTFTSSPTLNAPILVGAVTSTGDITLSGAGYVGSIQDEFMLILMGGL